MNKGFTLIELLAVLLILAVIALITTRIVLGVINSSRENAFVQSANSLADSIRTYQAENNYEALSVDYTNKINIDKLKTDGETPDAGKITIDVDGKVSFALWNDNLEICVTKDKDAKEAKIEEIAKNKCTL